MKEIRSPIQVGYINYIKKFHHRMKEYNFSLVYQGEVNQVITKSFASLAEKNMESSNESNAIKKKLFHVMVECLQNITKHTSEKRLKEGDVSGDGILIVGKYENEYDIITGNMIHNESIPSITEILENVNSLDKEGLKKLHMQKLKESTLSEKGGAGLGFVDIAKKTGEKLEYHFESIDDKKSFFVLKTKIPRIV